MGPKFRIRTFILLSSLLAGVLVTSLVALAVINWLREPDPAAIYRDAVVPLKSTRLNLKEEYWVGDVAGLYGLGRVSRRVAEADTAPITSLVEHPRPIHGYFVRAMESGPILASGRGGDTVSLKGKTVFKGTCAFCIYPAEAGRKDLPMWIVCPTGIFMKPSDGTTPVEWPKDPKDFFTWAIVD